MGLPKRPTKAPMPEVKTVLCIPCDCDNEQELVPAIFEACQGEYFYPGGRALVHMETQQCFNLELCDRDERMEESFSVAGISTGISDSTLRAVEKHRSVIYLSGEGGNYTAAEAIARAAGALLKAGGFGVKVETSGKAFDAQDWIDYLLTFETPDLYRMFVVDSLAQEDGTIFSCGMHNLGLRDTIVSGEEFHEAVNLIKTFSFFQIVDDPTIRANETFRVAVDAPRYVIVDEPNSPYKDHDLFRNPFGVWRLKRK